MTEDEYGALLQVLRRRTTEAGRGDLDARLIDARVSDASTNREAVLAYLFGLRSDVASRSATTLAEINRRLGRFETDGGRNVEGIVVIVDDQDRAIFEDREQLALDEFTAAETPLNDLDDLIAEVSEDEGQR